jgi:hypothetical protein
MPRITINIEVSGDRYEPHYVLPLDYHVSPGRIEVLMNPTEEVVGKLVSMVAHHAKNSKVEICYSEN